jgi:selenocysteine lyase/cysteine desulfurase
VDVIAARALFPGTQTHVFLDTACVGLMPAPADKALRELSEDLTLCPAPDATAHHIALDNTAFGARKEAAKLLGARPEDVALVESTTHGLEIVAAAVPLAAGDKVLVGETEFLGLAVPWVGRHKHIGFHIEVVPQRDGRLHVEDFAKAIDGRARLILLSSVQWHNGFRTDLAAFAQLARERGVLLVVDAIQQLGALGLDVSRVGVDFVVAGGHKWLNAPAGRGLLYMDPALRQRLTPPAWGYLNIVPPPEGWAQHFATPTLPVVRAYEFVGDARRFEIGGTSNYPGNVVLRESLKIINTLGIAAVEERVLQLGDFLIDKLQRVRAAVVSPNEPGARSGIITFTMGQGPARDAEILQRLLARRVLISQRYTAGVGGLRVSVHFYNHEDDVMHLVDALRKCAAG